jgi:hypothetical protein
MPKTCRFLGAWLFALVTLAGREGRCANRYAWKPEKPKNGCQIYTSEVKGKDFIAAKATCIIPARVDVVGVVLHDIPNYPAWMAECVATKVLKVVSDAQDTFVFWFHQHVTLLKDRDMVLRSGVNIDQRKQHHVITVRSTDEVDYHSGEDLVRMPSFTSQWTLDWIDQGHTLVSFMVDADPGPGLPPIIANWSLPGIPYRSIEGMMRMVREPKYIEAAKTSKYAEGIAEALAAGTIK